MNDEELTTKEKYEALKRRDRKEKNKNTVSFLAKFLTKKVVLILIIIALLAGVGFGIKSYFFTNSKTTKIGFENIGELATQVAYCTNVQTMDKSQEIYGVQIPFTQSKYVYSYDTTIKAGINFNEVEWELNQNTKTITVKMPECKILSVDIDLESLKVYHEQSNIFSMFSIKENNESLQALKDEAQKSAISNGLLENAEVNAQEMLKSFFNQSFDKNNYTIVFVNK